MLPMLAFALLALQSPFTPLIVEALPQGNSNGGSGGQQLYTGDACSSPVDQAVLAQYPPLGSIARIANDPVASDLFARIAPGIPDIDVRDSGDGSIDSSYDFGNDPDCWWTATGCTSPKVAGLLNDVRNCPESNTLGFTIDDGPSCTHDQYYDFLKTQDLTVTLFYIGSNVLRFPSSAQQGLEDGHELCSHSWSHHYMTSVTNEQAFAELYYSQKAILDVVGVTVQCWRPPYGDVDDRIRYIAQELGMRTVLWSHNSDDWNYGLIGEAGVDANYDGVVENGAGQSIGAIILTHEIDGETMKLGQDNLPKLIQAFDGGVVPVAVCMNWTQPYLEPTYRFPNYAQWVAGTRNLLSSSSDPSPSSSSAMTLEDPSPTSALPSSLSPTSARRSTTERLTSASIVQASPVPEPAAAPVNAEAGTGDSSNDAGAKKVGTVLLSLVVVLTVVAVM